jgi:hydroxymethylpyrimidine pyrophosphatase-like HAD family hydrolase
MHLVVFDIDGTLTNTNQEDGVCYWRAICALLGFSSEQPD